MTFPRSIGQIPIYYNLLNTGRPGPKDEVFWSHWGDESHKPLYPFGFGLSYTGFAYSNLIINNADQTNIKVSVTVTNIGKRDGEEFSHLYLCEKSVIVARPVKELKGFSKFMLKAGESRQVVFSLTASELGFYNNEGLFVTEPGAFDVMVGGNSEDVLKGSFILQ